MLSIRCNTKETILLLCNSNIKGASREEAIELKSSLVVLTRGSPRPATVEYPDLDCLLCINDICP